MQDSKGIVLLTVFLSCFLWFARALYSVPVDPSTEASRNAINETFFVPSRFTRGRPCSPHAGVDWKGEELPGSPLKEVVTAGECCALCKSKRGCIVYSYNSNKRECRLKKTIEAPMSTPSYVYSENFLEETAHCDAKEGYTIFSSNLPYGMSIVWSPAACCELCRKRKDCDFWTWERTNNRCYLKGDRWVVHRNSVSGTAPPRSAPGT